MDHPTSWNDVRAFFLSPDGNVYPDSLICSGILPAELNGSACEYSQQGRAPAPVPLDASADGYSIDKGLPGELCMPCVKQQLGHLGHWSGHGGREYPEELLDLRLFKCRKWFWLVVPGLADANPTEISGGKS